MQPQTDRYGSEVSTETIVINFLNDTKTDQSGVDCCSASATPLTAGASAFASTLLATLAAFAMAASDSATVTERAVMPHRLWAIALAAAIS